MLKQINSNGLSFIVFNDRLTMGKYVAEQIKLVIDEILKGKDEVRIIFASAPSQSEVLAELVKKEIPWEKVISFHMDEYIGLKDDSKSFAHYIKRNFTEKVPIGEQHYIQSEPKKIDEYVYEITKKPIDIVLMGIGENGHLAFNEPNYADFHDKQILKEVILDEECRQQQVNDGCFDSIEQVPKKALTLTVPVLVNPEYIFVTVPGESKRKILNRLIKSEVTEKIPATILKTRSDSVIYTDQELDFEGE